MKLVRPLLRLQKERIWQLAVVDGGSGKVCRDITPDQGVHVFFPTYEHELPPALYLYAEPHQM